MPYYQDIKGEFSGTSLATFSSFNTISANVMTGYRSRRKDDHSVEVPAIQADPYAYFLASDREALFKAAANARGMETAFVPDKGHTLDSYSWTLKGTFSDFTILNNQGVVMNTGRNCMIMPRQPAAFSSSGPFTGPAQGVGAPVGSDTLPNFGQRAIAAKAPKLAAFSISAFLGELMEGLPALIPRILTSKNRLDVARRAGGDYLNVVFGWIPLLKDLQDIANILTNATEVLSGKPAEGAPLHRKWGLPEVKEDYTIFTTGQGSALSGGSGMGHFLNHPINRVTSELAPGPMSSSITSTPTNGEGHLSKVLSRRQWFEGSFVSFYPLGYKVPETYLEKLAVLFDPRVTPEVVWQLSPWSWLIDWAFHIGDSIEANQIASDKLAMIQYAYAMEETKMTTYSSYHISTFSSGTGTSFRSFSGKPYHAFVSETIRKRRMRANPYGFTSGGLSGLKPEQVAILGALGLSRL